MIIGINYAQDGSRVIARIDHDTAINPIVEMNNAHWLKNRYDEVYIIPFIPTNELIDEVALKGCRL